MSRFSAISIACPLYSVFCTSSWAEDFGQSFRWEGNCCKFVSAICGACLRRGEVPALHTRHRAVVVPISRRPFFLFRRLGIGRLLRKHRSSVDENGLTKLCAHFRTGNQPCHLIVQHPGRRSHGLSSSCCAHLSTAFFSFSEIGYWTVVTETSFLAECCAFGQSFRWEGNCCKFVSAICGACLRRGEVPAGCAQQQSALALFEHLAACPIH
jgi:hypothetical protein